MIGSVSDRLGFWKVRYLIDSVSDRFDIWQVLSVSLTLRNQNLSVSLTPAKHALPVSLTEKLLSSAVDTGEALENGESVTYQCRWHKRNSSPVSTIPAKPKLSNFSINIFKKVKLFLGIFIVTRRGRLTKNRKWKISWHCSFKYESHRVSLFSGLIMIPWLVWCIE